jgi:hypothetical protein
MMRKIPGRKDISKRDVAWTIMTSMKLANDFFRVNSRLVPRQ